MKTPLIMAGYLDQTISSHLEEEDYQCRNIKILAYSCMGVKLKTGYYMRLSTEDVNIIKTTLQECISSGNIYLFGSRVADAKKGGDIDIYVETEKDVSLHEKLNILTFFETRGIQRRIDLIIDTPGQPHKKIGQEAKQTGVLL